MHFPDEIIELKLMTKITETCYIFKNSSRNSFDLLEGDCKSPSHLTLCYAKPEKPCQAVLTRNEKAIRQPTLNKGGEGGGSEGASFTIFVSDCLQNLKKLLKRA